MEKRRAELVLQIRRGGEVLGSWVLGAEPLEIGVVDGGSGREIATLTAVGHPPPLDQEDTLRRSPPLTRTTGDDLTLPLPEPTGEAPAAEPAPPPAPRRPPRPPRAGRADARPPDPPPAAPERPPLLTLESARLPDDDLTLPLPEPEVHPDRGRPPAGPPPVIRPAEVWRRKGHTWGAVGWLQPGHQVSAYGGRVRLMPTGELLVSAGPNLSGSATLPGGASHPVRPGDPLHVLPAGASVMLRWSDHGLYVRSEAVEAAAAPG